MIGRIYNTVPRRLLVAVAAVIAVGIFALMLAASRPEGPSDLPALSVHSSEQEGSRALALWLEELGYRPVAIEWQRYTLNSDIDALLVLEPSIDFSDADVEEVENWVALGGVLVVAGERQHALAQAFGVNFVESRDFIDAAEPAQPVFGTRAAIFDTWSITALRLDDPSWTTLAVSANEDREPVLAVRTAGAGHVYALASSYLPSNEGLDEADNSQLAAYLVGGLPNGARIAFDEYHHGSTEHGTFSQQLIREPWGWAVIYLGAVTFAYLAFHGRRFGPALPELPDPHRRSRAEYVKTIAAMLRGGRHDDWLAGHYAAQLKRDIARRFRVKSDLSATEFVSQVESQLDDAGAFAGHLVALENGALQGENLLETVRRLEEQRARLLSSRRARNKD